MLRRVACVGALLASSTVAGCAFDPSWLLPYGDSEYTESEPWRVYRYGESRPVSYGVSRRHVHDRSERAAYRHDHRRDHGHGHRHEHRRWRR